VIELAEPSGPGPLADHVARFGSMIFAVTFSVRDLAAVAGHLAAKGITTDAVASDVLVADPSACHGARYQFTTKPPVD